MMEEKVRRLVAKAIHGKNLECGGDTWEEMRKSGYECGCFEMADAVEAAAPELGVGRFALDLVTHLTKFAHQTRQTVGVKNDYYVTIEQLQDALLHKDAK